MSKTTRLLLFSFLCLSLSNTELLAQEQTKKSKATKRPERVDFEKMIDDSQKSKEEPTLAMFIRYQNESTSILHNEASTNAGYTPLAKKTEIGVHAFGVEIFKEFLAQNLISFNLSLRAGINKGSDEATQDGVDFKDEAKGKHYGVGFSINFNMEGYGMKIQPFFSTSYLSRQTDYILTFGTTGSTTPKIITYDNTSTSLHYSLGSRFINKRTSLFSFFSFDLLQNLSDSSKVSGTLDGTDLNLSNPAKVKHASTAFSVGAGFMF